MHNMMQHRSLPKLLGKICTKIHLRKCYEFINILVLPSFHDTTARSGPDVVRGSTMDSFSGNLFLRIKSMK